MDKDTQRLLCDISDDLCRAIVAIGFDKIENVEGILAGINDRIIEALMPYGHVDDEELERGLHVTARDGTQQTPLQRATAPDPYAINEEAKARDRARLKASGVVPIVMPKEEQG